MSQNKNKQNEEDAALEEAVNPASAALQAMVAFEDRRYLVQTVAVGEPDANGMRELTFPVAPTKQITIILAAELADYIVERMTEKKESIEVADLGDLGKLAD
jgi:hypothetical protein